MIKLKIVNGMDVWVAADAIIYMYAARNGAKVLVREYGFIEVDVAPETIADWIRRR